MLIALALISCSEPIQEPVTSDGSAVLSDDDDVEAIRAAYHERVRLGLGSPFRVMEIAAYDERLDGSTRADLLEDLFDRIADGDTYQAVHTLPGPHQRIVEQAITSADNPRVGELAVNLAYEVAVREKTITRELQYAAVCTAAMLRDRAIAREDAHHVRDIARARDVPPHTLVSELRAERALAVEQSPYFALGADAGEEASRLAMLLLGGVRHAAAIRALRWPSDRTIDIDDEVATRIFALTRESAQPPQSALMMTMRQSQLPFDGSDEEMFIAELARAESPTLANVAAQRGAIALRPLNQEQIWHSGVAAPSVADLLKDYGVRVVMQPDIPIELHAYYRTQLATALADVRRALPAFGMQGLTIEFAEIDTAANHLAFHDPVARVIRLAPRAIMGSLAHELGHDLDWQIAWRGYGRRSAYASDFATDVTAAMERSTPGGKIIGRPTETVARNFDWLIYAMLADAGRTNGTLTSVQHEWLPGHGGARPAAANMRAATAFAGTIGRADPMDAATRVNVERAVLSYQLPMAVHAVRASRYGIGRIPDGAMPSNETKAYIEELYVAAGIMKVADAGDYADWRGCGPFVISPCLR